MSFPRSTDTRPEVASATRKDAAVPPPHPAEFRRRAIELARAPRMRAAGIVIKRCCPERLRRCLWRTALVGPAIGPQCLRASSAYINGMRCALSGSRDQPPLAGVIDG